MHTAACRNRRQRNVDERPCATSLAHGSLAPGRARSSTSRPSSRHAQRRSKPSRRAWTACSRRSRRCVPSTTKQPKRSASCSTRRRRRQRTPDHCSLLPVGGGESACKRDSVGALRRPVTIHLCGLPGRCSRGSGRAAQPSCLALLPEGFAEPRRSLAVLVRSYRTVSPLPVARGPIGGLSLLHCPSGRPDLARASTVPCGVPTFLDRRTATTAVTRPTHRRSVYGRSSTAGRPAGTRVRLRRSRTRRPSS
jgi:hypothetical protein